MIFNLLAAYPFSIVARPLTPIVESEPNCLFDSHERPRNGTVLTPRTSYETTFLKKSYDHSQTHGFMIAQKYLLFRS